MRSQSAIAAILLPLAACAAPSASGPSAPAAAPTSSATPAPAPAGKTLIHDRAAAQRLLGAEDVTLQWISWDRRGSFRAWDDDGTIRVSGAQDQQGGPGRLALSGVVREIGADYFVLDGTISITDTPDIGRQCTANKQWRFAITQNRAYWRLREFEWCDGLTDYVDIYF